MARELSVVKQSQEPQELSAPQECPVNSWNEWDPLEEIVVGRLEGATIPPAHVSVTYDVPKNVRRTLRFVGGWRYPKWMLKAAQKHLDQFIRILEQEGVKVRRPEIVDFKKRFSTPQWSSQGFCIACPRDGLLVAGDEIIETPMAWRSRFFENYAYRKLFKEYFSKGARWTAAPRPELSNELFNDDYQPPAKGRPETYVVNEFEPVFDAADITRCGKDFFYQLSNVTNKSGIEWLKRHLEGRVRLHEIETRCPNPMHIDSTFCPLAPGKVLVNPEYLDVKKLPAMFKSWDIIIAPEPDPLSSSEILARFFSMCSKWIAINVLNLDEKRVIVEKSQVSMMRVLHEHGFEPIPCPFVNYLPFGGAFHCATLDIRRRGEQKSYF